MFKIIESELEDSLRSEAELLVSTKPLEITVRTAPFLASPLQFV